MNECSLFYREYIRERHIFLYQTRFNEIIKTDYLTWKCYLRTKTQNQHKKKQQINKDAN